MAVAVRDDTRVTVGSVWFVWGDHREVTRERTGPLGLREVLLRPMESTRPEPCFVEAWRVGRYGAPSEFYVGEEVGA